MNLDFTLVKYEKLCEALLECGYRILRFDAYLQLKSRPGRFVILKHDIDLSPVSAFCMARLENKMHIASSYYFRFPRTFSTEVIKRVCDLGHEIGYHYEALAAAKGDYAKACVLFERAVRNFKEIVPITTASAHGSLLSKWDNRKFLCKIDPRIFGIIGDTYLSLGNSDILYLTDTGRGWNKALANMRDNFGDYYSRTFSSTDALIAAIHNGELSEKLMVNIHPPRWNNNTLLWLRELIWQNTKNIGKRILFARRQ
jgi:hypothetical protein